MGANAQTSVPVFTSGQVLTAQQQTEINTGIPVFATSVERDAAFDGTGEKTLAEGQFAFLEDTNATQFYDGAVWQPVGVEPGLVQITSVSFTSESAVAFAAGVFDATYDNYRVLLEFVPSLSCSIACQVNLSGVAQTANQYFGNRYNIRADNTTGTANPGTSHTIMGANGATPAHNTLSIDVFKPAESGLKTSWHGTWYGANAANLFDGGVTAAEYNVPEADDGFTFTPSTGTITGKYTVYGYN